MRWRIVQVGIIGALGVASCSAASTMSSTTTTRADGEVAREYVSTSTTQNPSLSCREQALTAFDAWLATANSIKDTYNSDAASFEAARDAVVAGAITMRTQHAALSGLAGGFCMPPIKALADQAGEVTTGYEALGAAMTARDRAAIDAALAQTTAAEATLYDRYCAMASCSPTGPRPG